MSAVWWRVRAVAAVAVVLAVAVLGLAGCGVPSSGTEQLDPKTVPFDLLATASPTASPQVEGPTTTVYLVSRDRLARVPRHVRGDNVPAEAVRALLEGPTTQEAAAGLSTDVPAQTRLISLDVAAGVAMIDLSTEFGAGSGNDQVLAVAEIVYTLTESPDISSVAFAIDGKRVEVPDASGSLSSAPRTRADYAGLAPA